MKHYSSRFQLLFHGTVLAAALLLSASASAQGEIVGAPIDLTASVHEAIIPGGTIFDDANTITGAFTTPKESAEYLYFPSRGENLSGRSTNISGAFASSLAESDGNGGVGVSSWLGGPPSLTNQDAIGQLVSQASWTQTFTYLGTNPVSVSLQLHIPDLEVGLIGVAPMRSSPSAAETAEARATLQATITHPDLPTSPGASFEFGLKAFERQLISGTSFVNFADVSFIGANSSTQSLFESFKDNGDDGNPRFSLDDVTAKVLLGTLQPGDTVSYVYALIAQGTTHGFEHGTMAFLGDPFDVNGTGGAIELSTSPVPEPTELELDLVGIGFVLLAGRSPRRQSR